MKALAWAWLALLAGAVLIFAPKYVLASIVAALAIVATVVVTIAALVRVSE